MKSNIAYEKLDEDLLEVTLKFTFDTLRGPALRKKMAALGYKIYPMDQARMTVADGVFQTGQASTSIHNEFIIQRRYEITRDDAQTRAQIQEHVARLHQRMLEDLAGVE